MHSNLLNPVRFGNSVCSKSYGCKCSTSCQLMIRPDPEGEVSPSNLGFLVFVVLILDFLGFCNLSLLCNYLCLGYHKQVVCRSRWFVFHCSCRSF